MLKTRRATDQRASTGTVRRRTARTPVATEPPETRRKAVSTTVVAVARSTVHPAPVTTPATLAPQRRKCRVFIRTAAFNVHIDIDGAVDTARTPPG